jgi:hypothetical protein
MTISSDANKKPSRQTSILQQLGQSSIMEDPPIFAPPYEGFAYLGKRHLRQNYSPQESLLSIVQQDWTFPRMFFRGFKCKWE